MSRKRTARDIPRTLRGIRGATTVQRNTRDEIRTKTKELLKMILQQNAIQPDDIASVIFSVTRDLNAEFPAVAARELGLLYTPLLCTNEINVPRSLRKCIRILLHVHTSKRQREMVNIYLNKAKELRPDIGKKEEGLYYASRRTRT